MIVKTGREKSFIPTHTGTGVQAAINAFTRTNGFQAALAAEAAKRKIGDVDILACDRSVYHELSKNAYRTSGRLTLNHKHHDPAELAALATILRAQENWGTGITWEEVGAPGRRIRLS